MSLNGSLQIGRSGLLASQAAIEVAGNNLANVATRGYHKQSISLQPTDSTQLQTGVFIGRGVQIQQIIRQVDAALENRLRTAVADQSASQARQEILSQIESIQNEFTDNDLSSRLGAFFNAFSELANKPFDNSVRSVVVQEGQSLSDFITNLRGDLVDLRNQVDKSIDAAGLTVSDLLTRIEQVNEQITRSEGGGGGASGLRDQRDALLSELATYMDISTVESPTGAVDVFVGSLPVILNGKSRGIEIRRQTVGGELQIDLILTADQSVLTPATGRLGALLASRGKEVNGAIDTLDEFANQLIFQVNKVHAQGQGLTGFGNVTATNRVLDTAVALTDADAGLDFTPTHGSFQVHVTQKSTGTRTATTINVDLDGIDPANDTSLADLATSIDGINNISASITPDGRLRINVDGGDFEISFSDDSSGALAALGINTFFSGSDAGDMGVNNVVSADVGKIAAGQGHVSGDNRTALAIAGLRERGLTDLGNLSLPEFWNRHVEDIAVRLGQANASVESDTLVRENLEAQQQSVSGVNSDEEAIDLLSFQRAYQGSARFLSVVDELLQTLLSLV